MVVTNKHNLDYKEGGAENQYIKCPWCVDDRKKKNTKSLSVNIKKRVYNCHHCSKSGSIDGYETDRQKIYVRPKRTGWSAFSESSQAALAARGLSIETIKENQLIQRNWTDKDTNQALTFIGFPYFDLGDGFPVNIKWRCTSEKRFMQEKDAKPVMYNLNKWATSETLIICEGEFDVMAFNEAGFWNATTTNGGAINEQDTNVDGKLQAFYNCFEWIDSKKLVYIATDDDAPGRRLRDELVKRIGAVKCRLVAFPAGCKDANDVLLALGKEALQKCLNEAKEIPLSGVFYLKDQMPEMLDIFRNGHQSGDITYFGEMDSIFRWKKGQVNLWTGYANMGKTTLFLQMALIKSIMDGWKWALFSPENYPATDFYNDIVEMYVGKGVTTMYGNQMSEEDFIEACDFINDHFIFIYPEANHTVESLHTTFSGLMSKGGLDGVLIDPYNQLEKSFPGTRTDEEISEFMRIVKRYTVENGISYNIIAHPRQPQREKGSKKLNPPDAYDIAGGAMWANKSDNILAYHRPNWHDNKEDPTVEVHSQKVKRKRTGGKLGMVVFHYDYRSSRFHEGGFYFCDPRRKTGLILEEQRRFVDNRLPFFDDDEIESGQEEEVEDAPF